jgi:isopentenyl-diphosphate delta-isomerase
MENVILVDEKDNEIGLMEKIQAHKEGRLHRAFSVLIFNKNQEMLIHKRNRHKYHCGGLWTNACCSHPRVNENTKDAAKRRLVEEMGFTTELVYVDNFTYKASFDNGLTEYEYDHMFVGEYNGAPQPNPSEVEDWKYIKIEDLKKDIERSPEHYTPWFITIINDHLSSTINKLNYV